MMLGSSTRGGLRRFVEGRSIMRARGIMAQQRGLLVESLEPALDSTIPEKPCTVILVEDEGFYSVSWHESLRSHIPLQYGAQYCHQMLSSIKNPSTLTSMNESSSRNLLEDALDEMRNDFALLPSVILIARGPIVSLIAQYYLESLSLSGLIMVDPIQLADKQTIASPDELDSDDDVIKSVMFLTKNIDSARQLKLEPAVVPMLIVTTKQEMQELTINVVERHSGGDGPFQDVLSHTEWLEENKNEKNPSDFICQWIDNAVL